MGVTDEVQGDQKKLRELVLYVAQQLEDDALLGGAKLNEILYFCDFQAYGALGQSITGATYQRLEFGPSPRGIVQLRRQMEDSGAITVERATLPGGQPLLRIIAKEQPDTRIFSADERSIIDNVIRFAHKLAAGELRDLVHREIGWLMTPPYEDIPYQSYFISNEPLTEDEISLGRELAEADGLPVH